MSLNLQHIVIGIGGVIGGAVVNQHWNTTILPGIGRAWTGISTFATQRPELAIGIPAAIGVACAIYKLCGSYLIQKLAPSAPKGPEIANPLPILKDNFNALVANTVLLKELREKLGVALIQVTEIDLHRKLDTLISEIKNTRYTSLEVRLCSAKEEKSEQNVRVKLKKILEELSDIDTDLVKSLAKDGKFFVKNMFQVGKENNVFAVNIPTDSKIAGYYRLTQATNIHTGDISYADQLQASGGIPYTLFDRTGKPYMNKNGEVAMLSRNAVLSKELGMSSLEPNKKPGTVKGFFKSHPLPQESLHVRHTSSVRDFFVKVGLGQLFVQPPESQAIGEALPPIVEEEFLVNPPAEGSKPPPVPKVKKTGIVQQLRRLFTQTRETK